MSDIDKSRTDPLNKRLLAAMLAIGMTMAACGGTASTTPTSADRTGATSTTASHSLVLPVNENPIKDTSTNQVLKIDSVLVENNVDATGAAVNDHLEIAVTNSGSTELGGFEVFYTFEDTTAGTTESYYSKLPDSFTVAPGSQRVIHFDNTAAPDHFPDNEFSLYHLSKNALEVTVVVGAAGAATQTVMVQKDAGGQESAD